MTDIEKGILCMLLGTFIYACVLLVISKVW